MSHGSLVKQFENAGLVLKILKEPFASGENAELIFGMDIDRKIKSNTRSEFFRIYPGAETNMIEVTNIDKGIGQLVLMVKEGSRSFEEVVPLATLKHQKKRHGEGWWPKFLEEHGLSQRDVVSHTETKVVLRRKTKSVKRHFLLGVDERQLFIAQLPKGVSTVREAHASLKSPTVTFFEGKAEGRTVRQGEWFFVNITEAERRQIHEASRKGLVLRKQSIGQHAGRNGKPHTADELLSLPGPLLNHGFTVRGRPEIYVKGKVRHVDHKTVSFKHWRKVIANLESSADRMAGVNWVD